MKKIFNIRNVEKMVLIFILLQPFFDILSFLWIRNLIPFGISTYVKPIFVFGIGIYIFISNQKQRKKWFLMFFLYGILVFVHTILLKNLDINNATIFHELRFMLNIAYMLVFYMIYDYLYVNNENKEKFIQNLKKTLVYTFIIYSVTVIIAILTGTSGKTYEYSDAAKVGFKGWLDSGQIFGHALSIILPIIIYYFITYTNENKIKKYLIKSLVVLPVIVLILIGTKVTYFICLAILFIISVLNIYYYFREKDKCFLSNFVGVFIIFALVIGLYNFLPVSINIKIQANADQTEYNDEILESDIKRKDLDDLKKKLDGFNNQKSKKYIEINKYYNWDLEASRAIQVAYKNKTLKPSDTRGKQLIYNYKKFMLSDAKYKIFGLGYLNQPINLSIERDCFMVLFGLGLLGFIIVFAYPIKLWFKSVYIILKNLKKVDLETLLIFAGFSIFFCISAYAGYTFIYTNFSIYLVALMCILNHHILKFNNNDKKKVMFISSTGGHFNELSQLKKMFSKYDYSIVTEKDEITKGYKEEYGDKIYYLPYGTRAHLFKYIFIFIAICLRSFYLYIKLRPEFIVTTGTHTALPMCYIAKVLGAKIIFIETFANRTSKTLSGRMIYPIADLFIVQWEEMIKLYPKAVYGGAIY